MLFNKEYMWSWLITFLLATCTRLSPKSQAKIRLRGKPDARSWRLRASTWPFFFFSRLLRCLVQRKVSKSWARFKSLASWYKQRGCTARALNDCAARTASSRFLPQGRSSAANAFERKCVNGLQVYLLARIANFVFLFIYFFGTASAITVPKQFLWYANAI